PTTEPASNAPMSTTRRRFLTGAGIGVAAGAIAATGAIAITKPEFAGPSTTTTTADTRGTASLRKVTLIMNGTPTPVLADARSSLWDVMTYQLGMVGANLGCDRAECGACAVMVDGRAMNSCTVLAARLGRGQKIVTIEGLSKGTKPEDLHPVQRAYWQEGG